MPRTEVVYYQDTDGRVPALEAILGWASRDLRIAAKCIDRIEQLKERGHELRRPAADHLRDQIYELRVSLGTAQFRVLYFFSSRVAVLACGVTKEGAVSGKDIETAIRYKQQCERDPMAHCYVEPSEES